MFIFLNYWLKNEIKRRERYDNDLKIINDLFGHHIGDELLIILPQTDISKTKNIIYTLEKKLDEIVFDLNKDIKVSCSFGLAQYKKNDTIDSLLKKADISMYFIKNEYKKRKNNSSKI